MAARYPLDELLKVRESTKDTFEALKKIGNSECGGSQIPHDYKTWTARESQHSTFAEHVAVWKPHGGEEQTLSDSTHSLSPRSSQSSIVTVIPYTSEASISQSRTTSLTDHDNVSMEDQILKAPTASSTRRNRHRSSSIITNPYEDPITEHVGHTRHRSRGRGGKYSKYSPSPSIKKGKAEKLIKEHGSPPGIRVTAGGRIVPEGLPPIQSPLIENSSSLERNFTNHGFPHLSGVSSANLLSLNGFIFDVGNGNLCQVVDGILRPLDQSNGTMNLHRHAPNLSVRPNVMATTYSTGQQYAPMLPAPMIPLQSGGDDFPPTTAPTDIVEQTPASRDVKALEQSHGLLEQELKDLDRNEVLQRGSISQAQRAEIVRRRISLINRIDESRKIVATAKKRLEQDRKQHVAPIHPAQMGAVPSIQGLPQTRNQAPMMNLQYFAAAQPFQLEEFGPSGYMASQQSFSAPNLFAHAVPEFVPAFPSSYGQQIQHTSSSLQPRAGNVGLGIQHGAHDSQTSTETVKPYKITHGMASMNLDGSAQQPRRSHAIEIKNPNDLATKLNPASPTYRPSKTSKNQVDLVSGLNGISRLNGPPSTSEDICADGFCGEAGEVQRKPSDATTGSYPSDSSASTADFFPKDSYKYSAKKPALGKRCDKVNLANWMPDTNKSDGIDVEKTPSRAANKYLYDRESPTEETFPILTRIKDTTFVQSYRQKPISTNAGAESEHDDRPCSLHESSTENHSALRAVDEPLRKQPSITRLLQKASERAASFSDSKYQKNESYWEGYRLGIHQDILGENADRDHRIGYRDGILRSSKMSEDTLTPRKKVQSRRQSPVGTHRDNEHEGQENFIPSVSDQNFAMIKSSSFPLFKGPTVSPVPKAPANSLATTPTQTRSAKKGASPGTEEALDSPAARACFMSQPNITVISSQAKVAGTQTNKSLLEVSQQLSPLANRSPVGSSDSNIVGGCLPFSARMKIHREEAERQRYQKSKSSIAQTNESARGCIRQYDGSADDDEPLIGANPDKATATTPEEKDKAKAKTTGSPVKAKASAAVATMKQVAGIGSKRDEMHFAKDKNKQRATDPALMSSPEKRKWRESWAKTFRQIKKEEQEEIEKYKHENPAPR